MHPDNSLLLRHALKLTLIYLAIRTVPILLLYVINALPEDAYLSVTESHGFWLTHLYPVLPVWVAGLPIGFQMALVLFPVLVIEGLLVFLLSGWFLRRKPEVARRTGRKHWVLFGLAVAIWSFGMRHQWLAYVQSLATAEVMARQDELDWLDELPFMLMQAHWTLIAVCYATALLWAWLPTWLHFRGAKNTADLTAEVDAGSVDNALMNSVPLQRAVEFVSFLLGCLLVHFALVQAVYTGLWPWLAERAGLSLDPFDGPALLLTLSQILLATLVCALAAYVYTRRLVLDTAPSLSRCVRVLLAGAASYLLASVVFLALVWLLLWLNPGLMESLLQELSYSPQSGVIFALLFNVGALVLLCVLSDRMRASPRRWSAVLGGVILLAGVPVYVGWTIVASNNGTAGHQPGLAVTGELDDARWRNMEQWCTGVVETGHGTWLVGRYETTSASASYIPDDAVDLAQLMADDEEAGEYRGLGMFGSRPALTTLARLQDDGRFHVVATVPEVACLVVAPESEALFLFTGLKRPRSSSSSFGQTAVFRSADHGVSWEWLEAGVMPEVQSLAWSLEPVFTSDQDMWAWGAEPRSEDDSYSSWNRPQTEPSRQGADGTVLKPTALFHSADQGRTSTVIYSPESLVASVDYLRSMVGEPEATFSRSRYMDQERFVVQVDDRRAYAWVSERTWYHLGDDGHRLLLTTVAELSRSGSDAEWVVSAVTREPGVAIEHLVTSVDGRTHAILRDEEGEWLARLDSQSGAWVERRKTPSLLPHWLAEDGTSTRYFWSNGDYQVVSKWGYTVVPRLLIPFSRERAELQTDAHFYTRDGGRSWRQLAIPGYLGVMGLSPRGSKLYWSKGNWYSNDEPQQWEYDLAR